MPQFRFLVTFMCILFLGANAGFYIAHIRQGIDAYLAVLAFPVAWIVGEAVILLHQRLIK